MRANKHYEKWVNEYTEGSKQAKANYEHPRGRGSWAPRRHLTVRLSSNNAIIKLFALWSIVPHTVFYFLKGVCKAASRTAEAIAGSLDSLRDTD